MTYTATRDIAYCRDASALFHSLARPSDSLLLESADIETKKNLTCLAVLDAAAKVTCTGQRVRVLALSPAGSGLSPCCNRASQTELFHVKPRKLSLSFLLQRVR